MSIFKACDIRGKYGDELTDALAYRVGRAIGTRMAGKRLVVGGDLRPSTESLKGRLIEGILASGASVLDVGIVPTPAFYFATRWLLADGGVQVTGSHNPPGDNGFKLILGPLPITPAEIESIRQVAESGDFAHGAGTCEPVDLLRDYEDHVRDFFPAARDLHLVVDAGNGCYSEIAPRVLRSRGYQVTELYCEPDGTFPNRSPNPAVAENIRALGQKVLEVEADFGVAFDGDGDRAVFVDELGRVVPSDVAIVLFARRALAIEKGTVVFDIKCSQVVREEVEAAGGIARMEKSGHAFIKTTLIREGALLGGEISGHFFFHELGGDDGLYAALKMGEIIAGDGRRFSELSDSVPRYAITPDLRIPYAGDDKHELLARLAAAYPSEQVSALDGVRIQFPDGWALARISVTEPLITLRFEATTPERLREIQDEVMAKLPFTV